jgi:hypothetical protein
VTVGFGLIGLVIFLALGVAIKDLADRGSNRKPVPTSRFRR